MLVVVSSGLTGCFIVDDRVWVQRAGSGVKWIDFPYQLYMAWIAPLTTKLEIYTAWIASL